MPANEAHDIHPKTARPFNSLLGLGVAIEKTLIEHGIVLHLDRDMKKYVAV